MFGVKTTYIPVYYLSLSVSLNICKQQGAQSHGHKTLQQPSTAVHLQFINGTSARESAALGKTWQNCLHSTLRWEEERGSSIGHGLLTTTCPRWKGLFMDVHSVKKHAFCCCHHWFVNSFNSPTGGFLELCHLCQSLVAVAWRNC